ncbi:hypothetical protein Tco_0886296 [Tanacetum coccineum]
MSVVSCLSGGEEINRNGDRIDIDRFPEPVNFSYAGYIAYRDIGKVHNFYWFFYNVEFVVELKFFHWNNERFIGYVFLEIRNVERLSFPRESKDDHCKAGRVTDPKGSYLNYVCDELDFLNDLFKIGNSVVTKGNLILSPNRFFEV